MSIPAVLLAAVLGASTWILWRRFVASPPKLDLPYLQFDDGDNSDVRYKTQSRTIVSRGYKEVGFMLQHRLAHLNGHFGDVPIDPANTKISISNMTSRFA